MDVGAVRRAFWHLRHGGPSALRRHRARVRAAGPPHVGARARTDRHGRLTYPAWPVATAPLRRRDLRVAVVLDDFSRLALSYEWQQVEVTPDDWRRTLEAEPVDLLFVESAWAGNGGAWRYHLTGTQGPRPAFVELVAWCREHGVPTVLWNKEDPVHHEDFLDVARLVDHVWTTDGDMVDRYRTELGHDRVGVLPFAAQPALHHPVRRGAGRAERDVAFAGMWFAHRHPERREQLDVLLGGALDASARMGTGLEIYSRQLGGDDRYQFPAPYDARVVGSLDYASMLTAYRAHKVFLNVNTVVGSPTMCARRIYEITASGTPVVSTPSPAIDAVFAADEVTQVADRHEAGLVLRALVRNPELRDRQVHRAQRRIWAAHTYAHRVDDVLDAAGLGEHRVTGGVPQVSVLVATNRPHRLEHVLRTVGGQRDVDVQLVLLAHGWDVDDADVRAAALAAGVRDVVLLGAGADVALGECLNRLVAASDGAVVAKVDDDDVYGAHYLADQVHALGYSGADVVGKQAHFVHLAGADVTALRFPEREHRFTDFVMGPTLVAPRATVDAVPFPAVGRGEDTGFLADAVAAGASVYSADRFNFVQVRGGDVAAHTWTVSDAELLAGADVQVAGRAPDHAMV